MKMLENKRYTKPQTNDKQTIDIKWPFEMTTNFIILNKTAKIMQLVNDCDFAYVVLIFLEYKGNCYESYEKYNKNC